MKGLHWRGNLEVELFDVVSLLEHLRNKLGVKKFKKALILFKVEESEWPGLLSALNRGKIERKSHSLAPDPAKGQSWDNQLIIKTFERINRFRSNIWGLVAEILDLARLIGASAEDLQKAGSQNGSFCKTTSQDWQIVLDSGATSFRKWGGYWNSDLLKKHIHGRL